MIGPATTTLWEAPVGPETQVARMRRGDPAAFEELLAQYQHRLYRYLMRVARDPALADDLFQQTWLRVVEKIKQYDQRRNFDAWLFSVARNLAIDYFRRYRPESLDEPLTGEDSGTTRKSLLPEKGPSVLERLLAREQSEQLAVAMSRLAWNYREVLTLRFEEEMKLEEIAEAIDIPLSTAKTRLRRGLEQLRHILMAQAEVCQ